LEFYRNRKSRQLIEKKNGLGMVFVGIGEKLPENGKDFSKSARAKSLQKPFAAYIMREELFYKKSTLLYRYGSDKKSKALQALERTKEGTIYERKGFCTRYFRDECIQ